MNNIVWALVAITLILAIPVLVFLSKLLFILWMLYHDLDESQRKAVEHNPELVSAIVKIIMDRF